MNPAIFRTYDIRGIAGRDLTGGVAEAIGKAVGSILRRRNENARSGPVAVGRDVRESSTFLAEGLMRGVVTTGLDVVDLGIVPTPLLYFHLFQHHAAGGVIVTGSHNPPEFNGFKICAGQQTLYGKEIQEIGETIKKGMFYESPKQGVRTTYDTIPSYLEYLTAHFQHLRSPESMKRPVRVVVDAGNGTASLVAPPLLRALKCDVVELYCEPDGRFPHHHPDPTVPANLVDLQSVVHEVRADLGVAYDGDADRLGIVDERGDIVWGDRLLVLYARQVLNENVGAMCIGDVKCSQLYFDDVKVHGGIPLMWRTGHSLIKAKMRETGALLAGEMSGHFFFADRYYGFDDALYATCRLLEVLYSAMEKNPQVRFSDLLRDIPSWIATPEIRIYCSEESKQGVIRRLAERVSSQVESGAMPVELRGEIEKIATIDGLRLMGKHGWGLIRASNTEPALILRFEASTHEKMDRLRTYLEGQLALAQIDLGVVS